MLELAVDSTRVVPAPENADARWNLALAQLMAGDFAAGWENYEARRAMPGFAVRHFDAVIIVTPHGDLDHDLLLKAGPMIIDTRNALKGQRGDNIVRL